MAKQSILIRLNEQAADATLTDAEVATAAAIQESKLALDHSTADLYANSIRLDEDRAVASGVNIILNWIILVDQVTGTHYKLSVSNGEISLTQVA